MDVTKTNDTEGFSATLVPLLVVLASFIGAMLMSMQFQMVANAMRRRFNKWQIFFVRTGVSLIVSLVISLITIGLMLLFNVDIKESYFIVWLFQSTLFFSFATLTQMFVILFGVPGMVFNMVAVVMQLVSSGVLVPRDMVAPFYAWISNYLPATYGAEGYFSFIFGGGDLPAYFYSLLIFIAITLMLAMIRLAVSSRHNGSIRKALFKT